MPGLNNSKFHTQIPQKTLKVNLLELVQQQRVDDTYFIDEMARKAGHTVLRLPPYHCHLNPIELSWGMLKQRVRRRVRHYKWDECLRLIEEVFSEITAANWERFCHHTQEEEAKHIC